DRFDLSIAGTSINLAEPGSVTIHPDGSGSLDLDLTTPDGPVGATGGATRAVAHHDAHLIGRNAGVYDSRAPPRPTAQPASQSTCTAIAGAVAATLIGIALAYAFAPLAVAAVPEAAITWAAVSQSASGGWGLVNIILG